MKKVLFLFAMCLTAFTTQAQTFVDLGLPSKTKWSKINVAGFYTYDEAMYQFGNSIPTYGQWEELINECVWSWNGNGYRVTGPNGNSITLPAAGIRDCGGSISNEGFRGLYWTSLSYGTEEAWYLGFAEDHVGLDYLASCMGRSVRLVQ